MIHFDGRAGLTEEGDDFVAAGLAAAAGAGGANDSGEGMGTALDGGLNVAISNAGTMADDHAAAPLQRCEE